MPAATRIPRAHRAGPGRYARGATSRGQGLRRRRRPQPTGVKKLLARVPTRAAKQSTPRSKKGMAGGLAVGAAAAAGVMLKRARKGRQGPPSGAAP